MSVGSVLSKPEALRSRVGAEIILSQLDELPTLPAVAARLLALTMSDESSTREIVQLIESDAPLTAALLRRARKADLGLSAEATKIERLVPLLGFTEVKNLILSLQIFEALPKPEDNSRAEERRREFWKHSLAVACTADLLASRSRGQRPSLKNEAFVCGLLHDIGKVAFDAKLPKSYARVADRVELQRVCICDAERDVFGMDHTIAGKRLVSRWGLSLSIIECVWLHHQAPEALPTSVSHPDLVRLVHFADHLVRRQGIGFSGYGQFDSSSEIAGSFGLSEQEITDVLDKLPERMEPFAELVGLDPTVSRTLYSDSLAKANRELGVVNAQLLGQNRELATRCSTLDALRRFTGQLHANAELADVCMAAAGCISTVVDATQSMSFAVDLRTGLAYTGMWTKSDGHVRPSVFELDEASDSALIAELHGLRTAHGLMQARPSLEPFWQRCAGSASTEPIWLVPIAFGDDMVCATLFVVGRATLAQGLVEAVEWESLSSAMALAMTSARVRLDSNRLSEELLEVNRRLKSAEATRVRLRSVSMVGEMAAGAAHEMNNPLSVISGRAQLLLGDCQDEKLATALRTIVDQAHAASQIVSDLMSFAKPKPPSPVLQSASDVLNTLCQRWRAELRSQTIQIRSHTDDHNTTIFADPAQVEEMIGALIANAVEACGEKTGHIQINSPSRKSDETIRIMVEDDGVGMPPNILEHAVDPFFSSREAGRKRGLGLSRAFRLAEINGGRLWIESTPEVGTKVTIELPARAACESAV